MATKDILNINDEKFDLDFLTQSPNCTLSDSLNESYNYKVIVADDDKDIHNLTNILFKDFSFENSKLDFIHTFSTSETIKAIDHNSDIAVIILDVVMDQMNSGFQIIDYIRKTKMNKLMRIILRTGQPGYAPEEKLIENYDINDYKLKTELTKQKFFTTMYSCLRSYRDLVEISRNKKSLEKLVQVSGYLFKKDSFEDLLISIFEQITLFSSYEYSEYPEDNSHNNHNGCIFKEDGDKYTIISGIGKYNPYFSFSMDDLSKLPELLRGIKALKNTSKNIVYLDNSFLFLSKNFVDRKNYIFIETAKHIYNKDLIELLLNNYSLALENHQLNEMLIKSQEDIIFALTETIERHSNETSNHVKRVSKLMNLFAEKYGLPKSECDLLRISSVLHDIGKIGIPDSILKKPEKLTVEEFEVIKTHTFIGFEILKKSNHPHFKKAAEIAYAHHEKYDGTGYPLGISSEDIPIYARMMAIIDVFDALINKRCYKEALPLSEVIEIMKNESEKHFDPVLLNLFFNNLDSVMAIMNNYND